MRFDSIESALGILLQQEDMLAFTAEGRLMMEGAPEFGAKIGEFMMLIGEYAGGGERMKMRSMSHVGLTVTNFEEAVKWYHRHFGLLLISEIKIEKDQIEALHDLYHIKDTSARVGFLRAPRGGVIEIFQFEKQIIAEQPTWNRPGYTHVTFDVKKT